MIMIELNNLARMLGYDEPSLSHLGKKGMKTDMASESDNDYWLLNEE